MQIIDFIHRKTGIKINVVRSVLLCSAIAFAPFGYTQLAIILTLIAFAHWTVKNIDWTGVLTKEFFNFLFLLSILLLTISIILNNLNEFEISNQLPEELIKIFKVLITIAVIYSFAYIILVVHLFLEGFIELDPSLVEAIKFVIVNFIKGFVLACGALIAFRIFNYLGWIF